MTTQDDAVALHRPSRRTSDHVQHENVLLNRGSKANGPSVGFNRVETLLSAAGAFMTWFLGPVAETAGRDALGGLGL